MRREGERLHIVGAEETAVAQPTREQPLSAAPRPASLALAVVDDARGFDALEREWNDLLERSEASVFQSFEWQRTWWRHFGERRKSARLHLVTVRSGDELVAIAPLHVDRVPSLGMLRRLLFVGHRDSDYLDLLVARGREAECAELVAAHLAERPVWFDVAILEETPDRSITGPLLYEALRQRGFTATRYVGEQCPRTVLRGTWEETVQGFPLDYRREIRRRLRNIAKAYDIQLEVVPSGPEVVPAMREFIDLHQERWVRAGYWGGFADPRRAAFHCDVAERLGRRGWLMLAFLRADGRRCATNYGFSFRNEVSTFLGGAREDEALWKHSPSRVLHAKCMEWAIANGSTVYDFMRGTEHYKYELDAEDVPNWTVVAYPRLPRLTALRHGLSSALATLRRRTRREAEVLLAASREGGWLSRPVLRQLGRAARRGADDVARVARGMRRHEARDS